MEITKQQILTLADMAGVNVGNKLKEYFPEAFEPELAIKISDFKHANKLINELNYALGTPSAMLITNGIVSESNPMYRKSIYLQGYDWKLIPDRSNFILIPYKRQ